jgi:hypothetical protein
VPDQASPGCSLPRKDTQISGFDVHHITAPLIDDVGFAELAGAERIGGLLAC